MRLITNTYKKLKSVSNSDMKNLFAFFMLQFACRICVLSFLTLLEHSSIFNRKTGKKIQALGRYL